MSQSDWISVKDLLPEGEPIWAYKPDGGADGGAAVWLWTSYSSCSFHANRITHWIPIAEPQPPKTEAEIALSAAWAAKPGWGASDYSSFKAGFLAGWQACEKRELAKAYAAASPP